MALALVAFFASKAFKMMPHYFDYMSMDKIITSVEADSPWISVAWATSIAMSARGCRSMAFADMNLQDVLRVEVENNEFKAHLKYEKREPLIRNLDLVANFDKENRLRMP